MVKISGSLTKMKYEKGIEPIKHCDTDTDN